MPDCLLSSGLSTYLPSADQPWNQQRVTHLYRRLGFGGSPDQVMAGLQSSPIDLVDKLIDDALDAPKMETPSWADWAQSDYDDFQVELQEQILEFAIAYLDQMVDHPVRTKLTLFWQSHFVTRLEQYTCPSWLFNYYQLLELHALGNFKVFTEDIGRSPAMLVFLNGIQNTRLQPNENYARELFELFTLGVDQGYTQEDIQEAARALTGWNGFTELCAPVEYVPFLHDQRPKTIFGQTGNWNYDDLHNILFEERSTLIARHLSRQLYKFYISPEIDEDFVNDLAEVVLSADFEIEPVLRILFKSERFFDEGIMGSMIKSPIEVFLMTINEMNLPIPQQIKSLLIFQSGELGQLIFNPPDVAGWPGDRQWISTSLLTQRWIALDGLVFNYFSNQPNRLRQFVKSITSSDNDPSIIVREVAEYLLPEGLQTEFYYDQLLEVFKWEVPENYFEDGSWNLDWDTVPAQIGFLLQFLIRQPEYQMK